MIVFSFKDSRKLRLLCWVGSLCWLRLWSGGWHSGTLQLIQKPGWALHVGGFWEPGPQVHPSVSIQAALYSSLTPPPHNAGNRNCPGESPHT